MIRAVLFDYGETLVERIADDLHPLSEMSTIPFMDAAPTLARLRAAGYLLGVVSNTTQSTSDHMAIALEKIGLDRFFDVLVTSFDVGREKPDPAMFYRALAQLGCGPHEAAMVGNDAVKDIEGAASVGLTTILVQRGRATVSKGSSIPTFTVHSLSEIPEILEAPG